MVRLTRADLPPQQVLPAVSVRAASGATPGIRELVSDRPTIIALWDRRLTDDEARSIRRASERLEGHDGQLLWITPEANSEALRSFARSERLTVPRYADDDGRLASTLGAWTSHRYYVVDSTGRIRYQTNDLTEAVRLLEILRLDSRATV